MKTERDSLQNKHAGVQKYTTTNKNKRKLKTKTTDAPRTTHSDVGMPFRYPQISIPGLAHYGGGLEQGLEDCLGDEEGRFQYVFD
jgi:hypothetical protein